MNRTPDFDELIGPGGDAAERARLRAVHELLIEAGPPAELSPELEGPTLAMTLQRRPGRPRGRLLLLAASLAAVAAAFLAGYITGNGHGDGLASGSRTLSLVGTKVAPGALASLRIDRVDASGNWPMLISVTGLPKLPSHGYYTVFLVRNGKPFAPCGFFVVSARDGGTKVWLNAPYRLQKGDSWVVTKQLPGDRAAGPVVLRPRV